MRIFRLAQILESKYDLRALAVGAPAPHVLAQVKKDVKNAYDLYVNPNKAKEPIIQMLAYAGEPYNKALFLAITNLVQGLNTYSPTQILNRLVKLATAINIMVNDQEAAVRKSVYNSVRTLNTRDENYRELVRSKFGMALYRLSGQLVDNANILAQSMEAKVKIPPKIELPPPKALSKEQRFRFLYTPKAKLAGIDSLQIMEQLQSLNKGPQMLDDLIRSKSDNPPIAGVIKKITDKIKAKLALKQTNAPEFEESDTSYDPEHLFKHEEEPEHVIEGDPERADPSVLDPTEITRKQEQVKKEDEERAKRQKEWESGMVSKYNSRSLQNFLRKVSQ